MLLNKPVKNPSGWRSTRSQQLTRPVIVLAILLGYIGWVSHQISIRYSLSSHNDQPPSLISLYEKDLLLLDSTLTKLRFTLLCQHPPGAEEFQFQQAQLAWYRVEWLVNQLYPDFPRSALTPRVLHNSACNATDDEKLFALQNTKSACPQAQSRIRAISGSLAEIRRLRNQTSERGFADILQDILAAELKVLMTRGIPTTMTNCPGNMECRTAILESKKRYLHRVSTLLVAPDLTYKLDSMFVETIAVSVF